MRNAKSRPSMGPKKLLASPSSLLDPLTSSRLRQQAEVARSSDTQGSISGSTQQKQAVAATCSRRQHLAAARSKQHWQSVAPCSHKQQRQALPTARNCGCNQHQRQAVSSSSTQRPISVRKTAPRPSETALKWPRDPFRRHSDLPDGPRDALRNSKVAWGGHTRTHHGPPAATICFKSVPRLPSSGSKVGPKISLL